MPFTGKNKQGAGLYICPAAYSKEAVHVLNFPLFSEFKAY